MKKKISNQVKGGFTLVEMLIVIVIVGLLAFMAVSSFGSAQKRARLDIAVDTIMSVIKEQQGKARTGRQGAGISGGQTSCYGVVFQKNEPYGLRTVTIPYVSVSKDTSSPNTDYCDATAVNDANYINVEVSKDVLLQAVKQGALDNEKLFLIFKPPFASILETGDVSSITDAHNVTGTAENIVRIFLNQTGNPLQDQRVIQFDPITGTVSRVIQQNLPPTP